MAARLMPYDFMMAIRALPKRVARALPKSESAKTLVESSANKRGLSKMLDGTLSPRHAILRPRVSAQRRLPARIRFRE